VAVGVGEAVGVGVGVGVAVGVAESVGVPVAVGVAVVVAVVVTVAVSVAEAVGVGDAVGVPVGEAVTLGVAVRVALGVTVTVALVVGDGAAEVAVTMGLLDALTVGVVVAATMVGDAVAAVVAGGPHSGGSARSDGTEYASRQPAVAPSVQSKHSTRLVTSVISARQELPPGAATFGQVSATPRLRTDGSSSPPHSPSGPPQARHHDVIARARRLAMRRAADASGQVPAIVPRRTRFSHCSRARLVPRNARWLPRVSARRHRAASALATVSSTPSRSSAKAASTLVSPMHVTHEAMPRQSRVVSGHEARCRSRHCGDVQPIVAAVTSSGLPLQRRSAPPQ